MEREIEMRRLDREYSESERVSAEIYCDCVGAEQEQELQRWSVMWGEIGKGKMAKREKADIEQVGGEWREGGEQGGEKMVRWGGSVLMFNGG